MSRSADSSWLPLSNRADPENDDFRPPNVRLAEREGERLREEVTFDTLRGVKAEWTDESIRRFVGWYEDQRGSKVVCENSRGELVGFETPNRFTPEYREMQYAKAQSLERELRERWGRLLHTGMITLTASTTDDEGRPRPPVDHYRDLADSWESVRRTLSRVLDGREWEYLAILEPHKSGHVHIHLAVFVKGPVVAEQFQPVLDAHVRNSRGAGEQAHRVTDSEESAVSVRRVGPRGNGGVENLGAYLAAYMAGEYGAEATEMPGHVQMFYVTMWATGAQWFRPSNGAQQYMKPEAEGDEDDVLAEEWQLVGFSPSGEMDDVVEVDPAEVSGTAFRRIGRRDDPPPQRA